MEWLEQLKTDTLTALRFFSRLSIPDRLVSGKKQFPNLNEAATGFPVAGLIIAILPASFWFLAIQFLPPLLSAILAIALGTLITGALHEDGLADCADGLGGATTRERAMEIMRDSAIGTYGSSALFFSFALRIAALASLPPWLGVLALIIAHSTSRASMVIATTFENYVRPSGLGDSVKSGTSQNQLKLTLLIAAAIAVILTLTSGNFLGLIAPIAGIYTAWGTLQFLKFRLGGYTGDGLGAMQQIAEITIMVFLAGVWS